MSADPELLRRYVEERSEAAFAELVRRHLHLVYFAALRQVGGDSHRAQDVAQMVFTDLARKAPTLLGRATLTGWLHTSTRYAASKDRRAEFARQKRDHEAQAMHALLHDDSAAADWARLRPLIDDLIHQLDESDREAVLMRYFQSRPFAEIGAALNVSEDAARMRVERALEKLRAALARRGVASTAGALAVAFANQAAFAAPAGMSTTVTQAALSAASRTAGAVARGGGWLATAKFPLLLAGLVGIGGASVMVWRRPQPPPPTVVAVEARGDTAPSDGLSRKPAAAAPTMAMAATGKTEWRSPSELTRAGRATPAATLETLMLAFVESDIDTLMSGIRLGPWLRARQEQELAALTPEDQAKFGPVEKYFLLTALERGQRIVPGIALIRIDSETQPAADLAVLRVQLQEKSGRVVEQPLQFERTADGWRWLLPDKGSSPNN